VPNAEASKLSFVETEYPELNKYLESDYRIVNFIPILKPADPTNYYAITFILQKV